MKNHLFFELIRVAIGTQESLSRLPSAREWGELYKMANKQSLIGVCFAGLQHLGADADEGFARIGMSEMQYLTWMGMAAKIQQKNEVVNRQCVILGERLKAEGYSYCVLKGQGVARLYRVGFNGSKVSEGFKDSEFFDLSGLRQSGDIDVLMWKEGLSESENRKAVIAFAQGFDKEAKASEHHIAVKVFDASADSATEVELHYAPAYLCNPFADRRFKKRCVEHREAVESGIGFSVPTVEYDVVFMLAHTFRHYMSEGVGLRQLMDYYFVLKELDKKSCGEKAVLTKTEKKTDSVSSDSTNLNNVDSSSEIENKLSSSAAKSSLAADCIKETASVKNMKKLRDTLDSFNMLKFAGAVMWIMKEVFGINEHFMICEPNERLGRKLLAHVMQGGNFGHHNTETVASKKSHVGRFVNQLVQDMKLAVDYPGEALWAPLSMIREFVRIRI